MLKHFDLQTSGSTLLWQEERGVKRQRCSADARTQSAQGLAGPGRECCVTRATAPFVQPRANPSETRAEPAGSWGSSEAGLLFRRATCGLDRGFRADQLFGAGSSDDNTGPYGSWC